MNGAACNRILARAGLLCVCTLAAVDDVGAQALDPVVNGEALVRLIETADIDEFNARYQTTTLRAIPSRQTYLIALPPGADPDQFMQDADADPDTVWVELNYAGQVPEARGRCFYFLQSPDAQPYIDQPAWNQIELAGAHQQTTGGGAVVAVVDSGIDATHVALAGVVLDTGWNFVADSGDTRDIGNGLDDDGDGEIDEMTGHGTHVAGIIAWVAPDAQLMPVKVLDSDGNSDNFLVAAGIYYAIDQGVDVINVSVGSTYNSEAVLDAVQEAAARGIPVAAAAGNVDVRTPEEYPALNAGVMGVAAVDEQDIKSFFSNYHENLSVSAPGSAIFSTLPGDLYAAWNGTSMSTPMVSGAAALVLVRHPEWSADESRTNSVRLALMQSADNIDDLNPLYAGMLGAGRLNALAALNSTDGFAAAVDYPVGLAPEAVVIVELDGDGFADLAVANSGSDSVSVLLNQGADGYGPAVSYMAGSIPIDLAAGDFDGDNDRDLAVANQGSNSVSVLINSGTGSFGAGQTVPAGGGVRAIAAGNLDADGAVDLAVVNENENRVTLLWNDGGGGFAVQTSVAVGARPYDVRLGDVDGDDDLDLVVANRDSDNISVALNEGSRAFGTAAHYAVGLRPQALTLADFDGDDAPDVATANHDSRDITLIWNDGTGVFGGVTTISLDGGRRPMRLAAADLDCDDDVDLVATSADNGTNVVSLLLGRGDGTFLRQVDYAVGASPRGMAAGDVDGDGDVDLAVVGRAANTVSVLLNRSCSTHITGDVNCDGAVDAYDIDAFICAISPGCDYYGLYPGCDISNADANQDGEVNSYDIDAFISLLGG